MRIVLLLAVLFSLEFSKAEEFKGRELSKGTTALNSYIFAQKIVNQAITNLSAKMQSDARYRERNQDLLSLYLRVLKAMRENYDKIYYVTEPGMDTEYCVKEGPAAYTELTTEPEYQRKLFGHYKGFRITLCDGYFHEPFLAQAAAMIHEFLHFVETGDECATATQESLILFFAGYSPIIFDGERGGEKWLF